MNPWRVAGCLLMFASAATVVFCIWVFVSWTFIALAEMQ